LTQREVRKLLKRLGIDRPRRRLARRHVMALVGAALLGGGALLSWPHQAGPVALPQQSASELAGQRADFAQELYQGLTPLQRAALERLQPVEIADTGFTPEQRCRAWRLAQVGGAQFPLRDATRITAHLQRTPAAPEGQVQCLVRVEFQSQDSAVAYRAVARVLDR